MKNIKFLLLIPSLFLLIKSEPEIINIKLNENNFTYNYNIESELKFHVNIENDYNYNYLKIKVEGKSLNSEITHIISFYQQDSNFNERKQLSQSFTNTTIMWVTKEQIKNNFYFSIDSTKYPCNIQLDLIGANNSELIIDDQYTYYVTEENKNMNFTIDANKYLESLNNNNDYILTIWAKGGKEINSVLYGDEILEINSNHVYYRVNLTNLNNTIYNLTIEGKSGDLINIGSLLFKVENSSFENYLISESILSYNGIEISGLLKSKEKTIIKMNEYAYNLERPYNLETNEELISHNSDDGTEGYYTVELRAYGEDDIFYSYKFLKENNQQQNNKNYPQLYGFSYSKEIEEGKTIGIIPMKPDEDFKFLTYEIFNLYSEQEISVSIYYCNNYPLCNLDSSEKIETIPNFKTFNYYTYNKEEWGANTSPISKKQKMLLIKCEKGIKLNNKNFCSIKEDILIDKNIIKLNGFAEANAPLYKFIREDDENKYYFEGEDKKFYLNIETFSGNISITMEPEIEPYENGNKKLYVIDENNNIKISIKAYNNSIYSINDIYPLIYEENIINSGANYFLNIEGGDELIIEPLELFNYKSEIQKDFFIGIYPLECNITVFKKGYGENKQLIEKNGFFQEIVSNLDFKYNINNNDSCFFYISFYELDKKNGIVLANNISQSFLFNSNKNILYFSYILTQKDKDIKLYFDLVNEGKYKIGIYLNDDKFNEYDNINSNYSITLKSDEIDKKCKNFIQICKILLNIEYKNNNNENESILNIKVIDKEPEKDDENNKSDENKGSDENNGNNKENENKSNTKLFVLISVSIVIVIIIIIVTFFLVKTYRKNKNLSEEIKTTSFKEDKKQDDGKPLLMETYS